MIEKKPTYVTCRNREDKPADTSNKNSKVPSHHHHWTGLFGPEVHPGGCEARSPLSEHRTRSAPAGETGQLQLDIRDRHIPSAEE